MSPWHRSSYSHFGGGGGWVILLSTQGLQWLPRVLKLPEKLRLASNFCAPPKCCPYHSSGPPAPPHTHLLLSESPYPGIPSNISLDRASSRKPELSPGNGVLIWGSQLQLWLATEHRRSPAHWPDHPSIIPSHT